MQHVSDDMKLYSIWTVQVQGDKFKGYLLFEVTLWACTSGKATYQNSQNIKIVLFAGRGEQICRYGNRWELPDDVELQRQLAKKLFAKH